MIHLIVGRTCSGKSTLEKILVDKGMRPVVSHTTRPARTPDETGHIFIQPEQLDEFPERVTETVINGFHYFTTKEQLADKDVYVIDPIGMYKLCDAMPDEVFTLVQVRCPDKEVRKDRYLSRLATDDDDAREKLMQEFIARDASESEQFDEFEDAMLDARTKGSGVFPRNIVCVVDIVNDEPTPELLEQTATTLWSRADLIRKMHPFVQTAARHGILNVDDDGLLAMYMRDEEEPRHVSVDEMSQCIVDDPEGFVAIMRTLLSKGLIRIDDPVDDNA